MAKGKWYEYPLRLDRKNKRALEKMAKDRRNSINDEINLAVDLWLETFGYKKIKRKTYPYKA